MIEIKEEDNAKYCGFLCGPETNKQQEIVNEIKELKKVNPEFAEEFTFKLVNMLLEIADLRISEDLNLVSTLENKYK